LKTLENTLKAKEEEKQAKEDLGSQFLFFKKAVLVDSMSAISQ